MSVETKKETVRRLVEEVYNQHQLQHLQTFADPTYLNHDPTGNITPGVQNIEGFRSAFSDVRWTITQMLGEGDLVAVQWTATGAHQQPLAHMTAEFAGPASGKSVTLTGIWLFRFEGSKIVEVWNHWDRHHLFGQITAL